MVITPDFWMKAKPVLDESDVFSVVSILSAWWLEAPNDFLACAQAHGHICPGLAFGYFIGKTIQGDYPLRKGQAYVFVADNPSFCGNDAIRVLLDVTEEKKNFISKEFASGEANEWSIQDGAGVCVIWDKEKNEGQGVALGINMPKLGEVTGFKKPAKKSHETISAVFSLIPYLNQFQKFSTVRWQSSVNFEMMERLKSSPEDPYKIVGLME
jgi:formylmethanofuran dehydrogenase subunit E-like metal-binding protein